ncbi:MAG: hypothetical protein Q4F84_09270, partial [Fibrobacter sp.]|nr:hypothetical protein [Fibrobacter sp.]
MTNKIFTLVLLITTFLFAADTDFIAKEIELTGLKQKLVESRDSLQVEIAARWNAKQKEIEQRQRDKNELVSLQEACQKAMTELSLQKEKNYAVSQQIEELKLELEEKKQEWSYNKTFVNDIIQKESDAVIAMFPSAMDDYRTEIESVKSKFAKDKNVIWAVSKLWDIVERSVDEANGVEIVKKTILPDDEVAKELSIVRFGNVFGYGMGEDGAVYAINQSGRTGAYRYNVRRIENAVLEQKMVLLLPECFKSKADCKIYVPVDILQNEHSRSLITDKKETAFTKARKFIHAGGPVMIPLLLLPVWALILIVLKMFQFTKKRISYFNSVRKVEALLEKGDFEAVKKLIGKKTDAVSMIAQRCFNKAVNGRNDAENGVSEVLMKEAATLGSHLDTLAVLAAVA